MNVINFTDEEEKRIIESYKSGVSIRHIAIRFSVSKPVIYRVIYDHGLKEKPVRSHINLNDLPAGTPINCDKNGKQCKYRARSNSYKCDYVYKVGKCRGCEPTKCTAWAVRKRGKNETNKS